MTIAAAQLDAGSTANSPTAIVTNSVAPGADRLLLLLVDIARNDSTTPAAPASISGLGLTWAVVDSSQYDAAGVGRRTAVLYRTMGTPTPGAITVTLGYTADKCAWQLSEIRGVDTGGTNGSAAVVQTAKSTGTSNSPATTLAAFSGTGYATYGALGGGFNAVGDTFTPGSGFSHVGSGASATNNQVTAVHAEFRNGPDTSVNCTVTNGANGWVMFAVELKTAIAPNSLRATHFPFVEFPAGDGVVLDSALEVDFDVPLPDAGFGAAALATNDPYATTPVPGDIFAIDVVGDDGIPVRAFAFIYRKDEGIEIDPDEEAGQRVTFSGPGHLSILSDGRIEPPGVTEFQPVVVDFVFDWTHPGFDDSGWSTATEVISVEDAKLPGAWGYLQTWAPNMPENALTGVGSGTTFVLWASDGTTGGTTTAIGSCYFRDTFTVTNEPAGGHTLFFTCDNTGAVYIDGKEICSAGTGGNPMTSGFRNATIVPVELSIGEHTIAIRGTNFPPFGAPNPGGIACNIYDPTDFPFTPGEVVFETTSAMKVEEYASEPPGMSIGTDERLMIEAQQALDRFDFLVLDFDDDDDSNTDAWDPIPALAVKAGADDCYSTNLKIMSLYADVRMLATGWTLQAFNLGALNPNSGVEFEVGRLTSLHFIREDITADELLILSGVPSWSRNGSSGRRQGYLALGPENSPAEVGRVGTSVRGVYQNPREETFLAYEPRDDSERPWVNANFVPGCDAVRPTRAGGTATDRVMRIGCSYNANAERLMVTVSVKDLILQDQERILNATKG